MCWLNSERCPTLDVGLSGAGEGQLDEVELCESFGEVSVSGGSGESPC